MYEFLEGDLVNKSPSHLILGVHGVGYSLQISQATSEALPARGSVRVLTHLHTSEDGPRMFGFATGEERDLFRLLLSVSGVGPSTALALLSHHTPEDFAQAVADEDINRLKKMKGIGEKTAKRILVELKEKLPTLGLKAGQDFEMRPAVRDAVAALVSIGFEKQDAETSVRRAREKVGEKDFEKLVKAAMAESNR